MKRDIIVTLEYNKENEQFVRNLETCGLDELKEIVSPLFYEVCGGVINTVEQILVDVGAFKGGFVALTMNLSEDHVMNTNNIYHSDMIMFMDIHAKDYDQDPQNQRITFQDENQQMVFSTQIYPIFLKDLRDDQPIKDMNVQKLWALIIKMKLASSALKEQLQKRKEVQKLLKYR